MNIQPMLAKMAQQAASNPALLATIGGAHTEVGKNDLERFLHNSLALDGEMSLDRSDIISDFFAVIG